MPAVVEREGIAIFLNAAAIRAAQLRSLVPGDNRTRAAGGCRTVSDDEFRQRLPCEQER